MIHTATLLHDDVVDESTLRRGHATANASFGNAASVLVGDFLYSRAFQLMVAVDDMRVLRDSVRRDQRHRRGRGAAAASTRAMPMSTNSAYLDVIQRKTAKLFEAATRLGAVLGGASPRDRRTRWRAMACTSAPRSSSSTTCSTTRATTDTIGKNLGDDLAEGKPTLPLIRALAVGDDDAARIDPPRDRRRRRSPISRRCSRRLQRTGALDYARASAECAKRALPPIVWRRCRLRRTAKLC